MSTASGAAMSSRILVVEDEPAISDVISTALRFEGHLVTQSNHGRDGLEEAKASTYDLLVLDVMLPGMDGFEICSQLRAAGHAEPILFLTARAEAADRIAGFKTGGDDYLTKPFSVDELVLRVDAILRRTRTVASPDELRLEDLLLNPDAHEVRRSGQLIDLSRTEFRLLEYLLVNANTVVSKGQILANVWSDDYDGSENVVELYVGYLRRKLDDGRSPLIHTKRGAGYVLRRDRS